MPRGVAHSPELRAQVVAAVLAGTSIAQAAAQFKLDKSLVSRWVATVATDQRARDPQVLETLLFDLVAEHAITIRAQLQAAARPEWLAQQSAGDLAVLLGTVSDRLVRLLSGFRPVRPAADTEPPALDSPRPPAAPGG
jgi:transposase-like protein